MLPLGCLPLWGREGVTLIIYWKHERNWNQESITYPGIMHRWMPCTIRNRVSHL